MITVANLHSFNPATRGKCIFIDKSTPLGNPFRGPTREAAIEKYRYWLEEQLETQPHIKGIVEDIIVRHLTGEHVILLCHCAPKPCHGDVIKQHCLAIAQQRQEATA